MKLPFIEFGSGVPILLIHGFPLSGKMWIRQAESLSQNGFRVILPDLPGFGDDNSPSTFYPLTEMAAKIVELLDSLNIKKAIIGGLSMGGYVLFEVFRSHPEIFSAIVLCDTTHLADTEEKKASRLDLISKIRDEGAEVLVKNMLPNLLSENTIQTRPDLLEKLAEIFSKVNPESAVNALQSMAERRDSSDLLNSISVPTLLIFGEFDQVTNLENARVLNRKIENSELVIIEKAGHLSNLEEPAQFNAALLNFVQKISY